MAARPGSHEARFSLLDKIPLGVCVLAPGLVVRFWNACLEGWTGIGRAEVLGRDLSERFAHLRHPRYLPRLETVLEGGPPAIFSSQLHRHLIPATLPDGAKRIQHTVVTAIAAEEDGGGFNALVSIQDVTDLTRGLEERKRAEEERRRMEAKVRQSQKLESLGVLAGGIAHDFNNLLVGILGNADLTLRRLPAGSPGHTELQAVVKSARRAASLAHQMLAYSGKGQFVTLPLDLSEAVDDELDLIKAAISKKARLECHLAEDLPAVEADPSQVRQVLMNLVTNASDALEDHSGTIRLATGAVECSEQDLRDAYLNDKTRPGLYVYLEVSDTGHGMDEATLERIFDPFFTTKFPGRGLGLAAVLGIVRGHRGALTIESRPGGGSTFRVLFPSCEKPAAVAPSVREGGDTDWTSSETVLVVDDEELVRNVACRVLEDSGLSVITAANGEEGLAKFRAQSGEIAVVLLDMTMPELGGRETYEELRRLSSQVPVILTSGYSEQETFRHVTSPGRVDFIQKPYLPAELLAKVREALEP